MTQPSKRKFWCEGHQILITTLAISMFTMGVGIYHSYKGRPHLFLLFFIIAALVSWGTNWYMKKYPCNDHDGKRVHGE